MNPRYYTALRNYCTRYGIDWRFDTIQNPITLIWQVLKVVNELVSDMDELQKAMQDLITSLEDTIEVKVIEQLQEWLNDGTLENIINDALLNQKLDKTEFDSYVSNGRTYDMNRLNLQEDTFIGLILTGLLETYDRIILPKLRMTLAGRININKPVVIEGGSLKHTGTDKYMFYVYNTRDVHFKNIEFDHNNLEVDGVRFQDAVDCSVKNCYFHDFKVNPIFSNHNSGAGCITTSNAKQLIITENKFERIGYTDEGTSTWESEGKSFLSNVIALNGDCSNSVVKSNTFNTTMMPIFVTSNNIKITNNIFNKVRDNTIYGFGDRIWIEQNDFKGNEDEVIVIQGGTYTVKENYFESAPVHAIGISGNVTRLNIHDNRFEKLGEFSKVLRFRDTSHKIVHLNIESNIINMNDDVYYGGPDKDLFTLGNVDVFNFIRNYIIVKVQAGDYRLLRLNGTSYQYINFNENYISYVGTQTEIIGQLNTDSITYINFNMNKLINCYTTAYLKRGLLGKASMSNGNVVTNVGAIIWSDSNNPPSTGYYDVGTLVINGAALNDGSGVKPIMWVCVRAGNPATWKPLTVTM